MLSSLEGKGSYTSTLKAIWTSERELIDTKSMGRFEKYANKYRIIILL